VTEHVKTKSGTSESPDKSSKERDSEELDRELADSFPASDPPAMTQHLHSGAPDMKSTALPPKAK